MHFMPGFDNIILVVRMRSYIISRTFTRKALLHGR